MKIAIISPYPPSKIGLNEYTRHLVEEFAAHPDLEILILADDTEPGLAEIPLPKNARLIRCWRYNDATSLFRILRAVWNFKPDVINAQLLFSTFGDQRVPASLGLLIAPILRLLGYPVVVTLHHLIEFIEINSTVLGKSYSTQKALELMTSLLVRFTTVVVLQQRYADVLATKYGSRTSTLIRHGYYTYLGKPRSYLAGHNILVFGKFGTYKRLELAMDVLRHVQESFPVATLTVCGTSHPSTPNYIDEVKAKYAGLTGVKFTGYVPEEDLPAEFAKSDVMLLPYESCTGVASAELHACRFGLPIVSPSVSELSAQHEEEGIRVESFDRGNAVQAAERITSLFTDRDRMQFIADMNFALAVRTPMAEVAECYVSLFGRLLNDGQNKS